LQEQDGTEIVEVTTSVIAGPPDLDASSPAGGAREDDGDVVVVTSEGDARVNGESALVSPVDASDEHVTVVSSPAQPSSPAKSLTSTHSDAELDQTPSSPSKGDASASSGDKDKKKKKFRAPSFLKTKKKEKSGKGKSDKSGDVSGAGADTPADEKKDKEKSAAPSQ